MLCTRPWCQVGRDSPSHSWPLSPSQTLKVLLHDICNNMYCWLNCCMVISMCSCFCSKNNTPSLVCAFDILRTWFTSYVVILDYSGAARVGDDLTDLSKLEPPSYIIPSHTPTSIPAAEDPPSPTPLTPPTEKDVETGPPLNHFYPPNLDKHFKVVL